MKPPASPSRAHRAARLPQGRQHLHRDRGRRPRAGPRARSWTRPSAAGCCARATTRSDRESVNLIFEPGFSTAKQVTDISGRGVGMDVVRRNIEELRGNRRHPVGARQGFDLQHQAAADPGHHRGHGRPRRRRALHHPHAVGGAADAAAEPATSTQVFDRGEMLAFEDSHLPLVPAAPDLFDLPERQDAARRGRGRGRGGRGPQGRPPGGRTARSAIHRDQEPRRDDAGHRRAWPAAAIMSNGNVALILDIAGLVRVAHAVDTTLPGGRMKAAAVTAPEPAGR